MQDQKNFTTDQTSQKKSSIVSLFVRLTWMLLGYIPFIISFRFIMKNNVRISKWDIIYWATFIALISLKYIDYKFLDGETADGKPATIKNVRDYTIVLFIIIVVFYLIGKYISGKQ